PEYSYGPRILLCEQTDFLLFLKAFTSGAAYYDPAVKIENASTDAPHIKRRSQFRISHQRISSLYSAYELQD
ncbi:MvaI/BcnI family restriction endonuclease, partial [Campylobacter jejuni]